MWQPEKYEDFYNIYPYRSKRRYFHHIFNKKGSFLEVGSSAGVIPKIISKQNHVVGIDNVLEYNKYSKHVSPESEFICCDVRFLPFKSKSFERCLCSEVVEHIENQDLAISEMIRVCTTVVITTPIRSVFALLYHSIIKTIPKDGHISVYSYRKWKKFEPIYYGFFGYGLVSKLLKKNKYILEFIEFVDKKLEKTILNKLFGTNVFVIIDA